MAKHRLIDVMVIKSHSYQYSTTVLLVLVPLAEDHTVQYDYSKEHGIVILYYTERRHIVVAYYSTRGRLVFY